MCGRDSDAELKVVLRRGATVRGFDRDTSGDRVGIAEQFRCICIRIYVNVCVHGHVYWICVMCMYMFLVGLYVFMYLYWYTHMYVDMRVYLRMHI